RPLVDRLVADGEKLEGEFQMPFGFPAVRVEVAGAERERRMGGQKPTGLGRKDVRVAPDFVNRPAAAAFVGAAARTLALDDAGIRHVMEHVTSANRLGRAVQDGWR